MSTLIALEYLWSVTLFYKFANIFLWLFIEMGSSSYSPNKRHKREPLPPAKKKERVKAILNAVDAELRFRPKIYIA